MMLRASFILFPIWVTLLLLSACAAPNYHLIHPEQMPERIKTWSEDHREGELLVHLHWARPPGPGPFPTVLIHPHGGKTTQEMLGVIWDLAENGYMSVAADYKRQIDGEFRPNTFAWRSKEDVTLALNLVLNNGDVDKARIAALGFSQGGMLSLLMAAHASEHLQTVIAYYPVTDFNAWFDRDKRNFIESLIYSFMRRHFYQESGARNESEFRKMLTDASPMTWVKDMNVPILLIHGDADNSAPVDESRKLYAELRGLGKTVDILEVPNGVHIFNWRQENEARLAWSNTLQWLQKYIR